MTNQGPHYDAYAILAVTKPC